MLPDITTNSKMPNLKTTIFTIVNELARAHDAVNLSQGFPDFDASPELLSQVSKAMQSGHNQYAPMRGILSLRETIAATIENLHGHRYNPESEITITAGATQGIFTAISAFVKKGDEVIVLTPAYDSYIPAINLNGGVVVPVALSSEDFAMDIEGIKEAISPKTRMLIINTPHNPSGRIFSKNQMQLLQEVLRTTDIIVLSDEVYEHIVFDGKTHQSVAKFENLASRSIICSSFGKTFHVTGWKIGYCVGPKYLIDEFNKVHQYNVFCVNHPIQKGLNAYLQEATTYLNLGSFYQKKRDYFLKAIGPSRFKFAPSEGTFFQLLDYSAITDDLDLHFVERLIKQHKLASIPVSVFHANHLKNKYLRFCFAKSNETLDKAAAIINKI